MIALLQRVSQASVVVDSDCIAEIGPGLLALVAVQRGDRAAAAARLAERIANYRIFCDAEGKMNLNVVQAGGAVLVVPQFTLAADTGKGNRPGFAAAAAPDEAQRLFGVLVEAMRARLPTVSSGRFGADMKVALVNEGPVTIWLEVPANCDR